MTGKETEKNNTADSGSERKPVEVYSERAESISPELSEDEIRAFALAYAKYLKAHDLEPGDATFVEPEELIKEQEAEKAAQEAPEEAVPEEAPKDAAPEEAAPEEAPKQASPAEAPKPAAVMMPQNTKEEKQADRRKKQQARKKKKARSIGKKKAKKMLSSGSNKGLAALVDMHDRIQDGADEKLAGIGKDFAKGTHAIASTYRNSRRSIGMALLFIGLFAAAILIIFDRFTVYEYAYNGKVLGYVSEQEEVTDVLDIAGKKLTQNSKGETGVEFVANQNVTFDQVEAKGKSTDDADTVVNKLIYMTDIETEAFAIYDGDRIVAIVKDRETAEDLLNQSMAELSTPDRGMELVSAEFTNTLDIQPINVLLGSVQSYQKALRQMVKGGSMETYHIVEEGETIESLAQKFGVDVISIYNEDNSEVVTEIEQGDRVCIHSNVDPVSVKMVETGKLKEIIEYETIKKETDEYYKGDSFVDQEGQDGVQIFEGTLTKVGGEVTDRDEKSIEVIRKKRDK